MDIDQSVINAASVLSGEKAESIDLSMTPDSIGMDSLDHIELIVDLEIELQVEMDESELSVDGTFQELADYIKAII